MARLTRRPAIRGDGGRAVVAAGRKRVSEARLSELHVAAFDLAIGPAGAPAIFEDVEGEWRALPEGSIHADDVVARRARREVRQDRGGNARSRAGHAVAGARGSNRL